VSTKFNLAWHEKDIKRAESYLVYVLVPAWLRDLSTEMIFDRVSFAGVPLPRVRAWAGQLASPRAREDQEGVPHPLELKLIRSLQVKADLAHNPLPVIVATTKFRSWSQLELPKERREILLRAGGAIR
jgi:hypothetical protein